MKNLTDIVQRYYDAFNRRDLAAYETLFAPDCLIEGPGMQARGVAAARAFDQGFLDLLPDGKIVNLGKATHGNVVVCENNFRATGFDERYAAAFELDGERIKRQTLYYDRLRVMELTGADNRNINVVRGVYDAFGRQDMQHIVDALADDVSWGIDSKAEVPAYGILHGKQNVPKFFAAWGTTADFTKFEASNFIAAGDHVFCTLNYELVVKATGKRVVNSGCMQHWTLKDGKIVRWRGWEDTAATRDAYRS